MAASPGSELNPEDAEAERQADQRSRLSLLGPEPSYARGLGLERLLFFSDAVFAIAITLLVLDLLPSLPPDATESELIEALGRLLPELFAYVLSFFAIGLYWMAHWRRFQWIVSVDEQLLAINLLLLGFIAIIPLPTALIGGHGDRPLIVVIYALTLSAAGVLGPASWLYAARAGLTRPDLPPGYVAFGAVRGLSVPVVMLSSLALLPFTGPYVVELSWLLMAPLQWWIARRGPRGGPATAEPQSDAID